jgi:hypothetical protein
MGFHMVLELDGLKACGRVLEVVCRWLVNGATDPGAQQVYENFARAN